MALTDAQKEWTIWLFDDANVLDRTEKPPVGQPGDAQTALVADPSAAPDARLAALYKQIKIDVPGGQLSAGDSCWSPKLALLGAWTAVIGAGAGTIALVLAPDPTTLTKWAALASAAALVGALVGLAAAYGAIADCEQAAEDAAERRREIDELRAHQRSIEKTVEDLKRQIGSH